MSKKVVGMKKGKAGTVFAFAKASGGVANKVTHNLGTDGTGSNASVVSAEGSGPSDTVTIETEEVVGMEDGEAEKVFAFHSASGGVDNDITYNYAKAESGKQVEQRAGEDTAQPSSTSYSLYTEINTEGKMTTESAYKLSEAGLSVGQIANSTGFRVGTKYMMTASHVIKSALGCSGPVTKDEVQEQLKRQGLSITFKFAEPHLSGHKPFKVDLRRIVFFRDERQPYDNENIDVTIAELGASEYPLPKPFAIFYDNNISEKVNLLGHDSGWDAQQIGFSNTLVHRQHFDIIFNDLKKYYGEEILVPKFNRFLVDPCRIQFQGPFKFGGSGSPCVVVKDGKVKLLAMLTHGFYEDGDKNVPEHLKIQEATRMWCVMEKLRNEDNDLCVDIFGGWDAARNEEPMD